MALQHPELSTPHAKIVLARSSLARAMLEFQLRNRDHLAPWGPAHSDAFYTEAYWITSFRQAVRDWDEGRSVRLLMLDPTQPQRVIGTISYTNIVRGVFQACHLGYSIDAHHEGKGQMRHALKVTNDYMFQRMKLHRIMANYQPHNDRSARLLSRLGFMIEGKASRYLFLDGEWRDHVLTSLINPDFNPETILS